MTQTRSFGITHRTLPALDTLNSLATRLVQEHDNIRSALRWSIDVAEIETGLNLATAIWQDNGSASVKTARVLRTTYPGATLVMPLTVLDPDLALDLATGLRGVDSTLSPIRGRALGETAVALRDLVVGH